MDWRKRYEVRVEQDRDAEDPRAAWDHDGALMLCWHRRRTLGDPHPPGWRSIHEHDGWEAVASALREQYEPLAMLPIYGYEHGGMTIRTEPFGDPWDSGQLGYILALPGDAWAPMTAEAIEASLRAQVGEVDAWLQGDVYGYRIVDRETGDEVESCWGFYGCTGGTSGADFARQEGEESAQALAQHAAREEAGIDSMMHL